MPAPALNPKTARRIRREHLKRRRSANTIQYTLGDGIPPRTARRADDAYHAWNLPAVGPLRRIGPSRRVIADLEAMP